MNATWVQDKIDLYDGELVVFKRANSPNWYFRVYVQKEGKHYQKSTKTQNQYQAIEYAKAEYKTLQLKVAKEEKVFTIQLAEAIEEYYKNECDRIRRGILKEESMKKKVSYLRNQFLPFFGDIKVNEITDKQFGLYVDYRLKKCRRKQTIKQELTYIKQFYKSILLKQGYVFRIPEIPEFKIREKDRSKRDDTFTIKEYDKLVRFIREWVKEKNVPRIRIANKAYGNKENTEKRLKDWEWEMEKHRRILLREFILIAANTGLRCPQEVLSLRWSDVKIRKEVMEDAYGSRKEKEVFVSVIQVNEEQKTGKRLNIGCAGSYFLRLHSYFVENLNHVPKDSDPVFMEMFGRRKYNALDRYALYRLWGEMIRDSGLDRIKFTLYHLRHFSITQQILNGVDLMLIAKNMGNSINTIARHYEHIDMEKNTRRLIQRRNTRLEIENEVVFR